MVQFRILGFPTRIESSAWILAFLLLAMGLRDGDPITAVATVFIGAGSILVHELGHALMARGFRLHPIDMTLHGLGGLTRHRRADRPWKELLVTLAGPAAGLALSVVGFVSWAVAPAALEGVASRLATLNLVWSIFNLLPLFPMDGGMATLHVLRMTAPQWAVPVTHGLGLVLSVGLIGLALWGSQFLLLLVVGGFVFQNAQHLQAWWAGRPR